MAINTLLQNSTQHIIMIKFYGHYTFTSTLLQMSSFLWNLTLCSSFLTIN